MAVGGWQFKVDGYRLARWLDEMRMRVHGYTGGWAEGRKGGHSLASLRSTAARMSVSVYWRNIGGYNTILPAQHSEGREVSQNLLRHGDVGQQHELLNLPAASHPHMVTPI